MQDKSALSALVVTENEAFSDIITTVLEDQKYRVIRAKNGNEAKLKFSNEDFAYVLLDFDMKGLKVVHFVETIRQKEQLKNVKKLKPILIFGGNAEDFTQYFSQVDHINFLEAPFTDVEFRKKLLTFSGNSKEMFSNTEVIKADEYLINEGGTSHEMYWVLSGEFVITKSNADGQNVIIGKVLPGELVGEMSFLDNLPRSASVKALEDSEVLKIPHKKFIDVLEGQPRWFRSLMQTLSQRLRHSNSMIARKHVAVDSDKHNDDSIPDV